MKKNTETAENSRHGRRYRRDITGQRFGRLTAVRPTDKRSSNGSVIWECICDCGNKDSVSVDGLVRGDYASCGCKRKEINASIGSTLTFTDGTCVEWLKNRKHRSDNTTGFRGVSATHAGKYRASIGFKGRRFHLGNFDSFEEAAEKRKEAEKAIHDAFIEAEKRWKEEGHADSVYFEAFKTGKTIYVRCCYPDLEGTVKCGHAA